MIHSYPAITNPKLTCYFPSAIPNSYCSFFSFRTTSRGKSRFKIWSKIDYGSVEKFLQNNSIADFMRFKKDSDAQLQTAIVSYRKKFPWSLLQPFLQDFWIFLRLYVDLVSTIHIADKEYFETLQDVLEPYDCVLYEMITSRESLETRRNPAVRKKLKAQQ